MVVEAVCSGTPVLASRIDGNVGLLGADYEGYFPPGDAPALAALLAQARATQHQPDGLLARLQRQCALRAPAFHPDRERRALQDLVAHLAPPVSSGPSGGTGPVGACGGRHFSSP